MRNVSDDDATLTTPKGGQKGDFIKMQLATGGDDNDDNDGDNSGF